MLRVPSKGMCYVDSLRHFRKFNSPRPIGLFLTVYYTCISMQPFRRYNCLNFEHALLVGEQSRIYVNNDTFFGCTTMTIARPCHVLSDGNGLHTRCWTTIEKPKQWRLLVHTLRRCTPFIYGACEVSCLFNYEVAHKAIIK